MKVEKHKLTYAKTIADNYRSFIHRHPDASDVAPAEFQCHPSQAYAALMSSINDYFRYERKLALITKAKKKDPNQWLVHALKDDDYVVEEKLCVLRMKDSVALAMEIADAMARHIHSYEEEVKRGKMTLKAWLKSL